VKRSVPVDQRGGLLAVVVAGANAHDQRLLAATLDALVLPRPRPTPEAPQHLCLDKGYDRPPAARTVRARGYTPHLRRIGEEKRDPVTGERRHPARRWVVERALAWLSKCRALLVRYEKKAANYLGLIKVAAILLWYRRWWRQARTG
jgi:putative transposase